MSDDLENHDGASTSASEFADNIKALFSNNKEAATKQDVAGLYAMAVLLFDAISSATTSLSYDPRTEEGIAAGKRYSEAMERTLSSIKTGMEQLVMSKIDDRQ